MYIFMISIRPFTAMLRLPSTALCLLPPGFTPPSAFRIPPSVSPPFSAVNQPFSIRLFSVFHRFLGFPKTAGHAQTEQPAFQSPTSAFIPHSPFRICFFPLTATCLARFTPRRAQFQTTKKCIPTDKIRCFHLARFSSRNPRGQMRGKCLAQKLRFSREFFTNTFPSPPPTLQKKQKHRREPVRPRQNTSLY